MNIIYTILSFVVLLSMMGWGRPGPLKVVEKAEKSARRFGVIWLCTWSITLILFPIVGFTINIWIILHLAMNCLMSTYLVREFFFKRTRDILIIMEGNNYGAIIIIFASFTTFFTGQAALSL